MHPIAAATSVLYSLEMRKDPLILAICLVIAIVVNVVWGKPDPPLRFEYKSNLSAQIVDDCIHSRNFLVVNSLNGGGGIIYSSRRMGGTYYNAEFSKILSIHIKLLYTKVTYRSVDILKPTDRQTLVSCTSEML